MKRPAAVLQDAGHVIMGGALINEDGQMIGTDAVAQCATREERDRWLAADPYMTAEVSRRVRSA